MAYVVGPTKIPGGSFRPWQSRLTGMGDYKRATFYVPTTSGTLPAGAPVTGGLGAIDLSSIPWWGWAAAGVAAFMLIGGGARHRRRRRKAAVAE